MPWHFGDDGSLGKEGREGCEIGNTEIFCVVLVVFGKFQNESWGVGGE